MADNTNNNLQFSRLLEMGLLAIKKENFDYAVELFTTACSINPNDINCRHQLRLAKIQRLKKNPPNLTNKLINFTKYLYIKIIISYCMLSKNQDKAIALLEETLNFYISADVLLKLATLLETKNAHVETINTYKEILTINPAHKKALTELIKFYFDKKDFKLAKSYLQALFKYYPHDQFALKTMRDIDAIYTIDKTSSNGDRHQ